MELVDLPFLYRAHILFGDLFNLIHDNSNKIVVLVCSIIVLGLCGFYYNSKDFGKPPKPGTPEWWEYLSRIISGNVSTKDFARIMFSIYLWNLSLQLGAIYVLVDPDSSDENRRARRLLRNFAARTFRMLVPRKPGLDPLAINILLPRSYTSADLEYFEAWRDFIAIVNFDYRTDMTPQQKIDFLISHVEDIKRFERMDYLRSFCSFSEHLKMLADEEKAEKVITAGQNHLKDRICNGSWSFEFYFGFYKKLFGFSPFFIPDLKAPDYVRYRFCSEYFIKRHPALFEVIEVETLQKFYRSVMKRFD